MEYSVSARQTGRTTRMLKDAFVKSSEMDVYVVCANSKHARMLSDFARTVGLWNDRMQFTTWLSYEGKKIKDGLEAHRELHEVFIDHFAIEVEYSSVFERLHRYDETVKPK